MRFGIRIKYSDDPLLQRCLYAAGGKVVESGGKPQQFGFSSEMQRVYYEKLVKEQRRMATAPTVTIQKLKEN